ncbi:MAG: type VII toxin-antitoxin system HepT family RNase toxin [Persicimonas sp.]
MSLDLANHLIAENAWATPKSAAQAFEMLRDRQILDEDFTATLISMVGFRNIAVHAYGTLDNKIVRDIVENHLDDLRRFSRTIVDLTVAA